MKITPLDPWICTKIAASPAGWTRRELEDWQLLKLNETLALARGKSSFYRDHLQGQPETLSNLAELSHLPFTTPQDLRHNPLQFVCVSQDEIRRVVTLQSSGTSGEPKRLYFTEADQQLTIDFFGIGMSTLTEPGERVLILLPGETPGSVGDLLRLGLERLNRLPLPHGPVRDPLQVLKLIDEQAVDCLVGSPGQVLGLARRGGLRHPPRSVLLSTDYVPAAIVAALRHAWGCEVYNHYGATEMGLGGGVECQARRGYHLREADLYFEVIDPLSGETLPEGQYGEVVFTTLTRRGLPLIRYRMGDRSRFLPGSCPCGTGLRTLERVSGRFSNFVPLAGQMLSLSDFDEALFPIPGLLNFSVEVTGEDAHETLNIDIQMLTEQDATARIEDALQKIPGVKDLEVIIHCRHSPAETGSIMKRVISDKRGQHA